MARRPATRAARGLKPSETSIHMSVAAFIRHAWPDDLPWWHTPNGGKRQTVTRTKRDGSVVTYSPEAAKLKAMGALAGVPDLAFILPNAQIAFIELKTPKGNLSEEQVGFRDRALDLRCGYEVCRSVDEVEAVLSRWLSLFQRKLRASTVRRVA